MPTQTSSEVGETLESFLRIITGKDLGLMNVQMPQDSAKCHFGQQWPAQAGEVLVLASRPSKGVFPNSEVRKELRGPREAPPQPGGCRR